MDSQTYITDSSKTGRVLTRVHTETGPQSQCSDILDWINKTVHQRIRPSNFNCLLCILNIWKTEYVTMVSTAWLMMQKPGIEYMFYDCDVVFFLWSCSRHDTGVSDYLMCCNMFPVKYEHHLHILKQSYALRRRPWKPTVEFLVRYEHHLGIKRKAISVTGRGGPYVFPVRYDHHLHIKSKDIPVTGSGGPQVFPVRYQHHLHIKM
jgi:hypothetical protein